MIFRVALPRFGMVPPPYLFKIHLDGVSLTASCDFCQSIFVSVHVSEPVSTFSFNL